MHSTPVVRAALAALALLTPPSFGAPGEPRRCERFDHEGPLLAGHARTIRVCVPRSYGDSAAANRRYPVVYLLHGWPGSDGNWPSLGRAGECADSLSARGEMPEALLVFPNGSGAGWLGRSYWLDDWVGRMPVESWLVRDVVPWVDRKFRTRASPETRAVIGLSDGGTAAVRLALRHPDVFGAAASHSGTFRLPRAFGDGGIVGPDSGAARFLDRNSPATMARERVESARRLALYFDCGADDESLADNRSFARELDSLRVPHEYREYPGTHDWAYWRRHLAESLVAVTRRMPR